MKFAILYSGRIHNYENTYITTKQYIKRNNDVDIYLSHSPELDTNEALQSFIQLYKPVAVKNEKITYGDVSRYYKSPETNINNCMFMYFNRKRVWNVLEKCIIKYDLYISHRVDIEILEHLNYDLFKGVKDDEIYIPEGCDWRGGINDQFAVSNF